MRKHKLLSLLLVMVFVASIALTGCNKSKPADNTSTSSSSTSASSSQEEKLDADQTVNVVGYDYTSLDPASVSDAESFTTFAQVYEGIGREVIKDGKDNIELAAGITMDVSSDGLTYTFHLGNQKWSDGKDVTAQDYEFGWKRLIDPKNAFDYMTIINMVKGVPEYQAGTGSIDNVGIKAVDPKTFQVTLAYPCPYFDKLLAFKCLVPQRQDVFTALGQNYGQDWQKMVYDGPFVVSNYQKGSTIEYSKNANYWDAANVKLSKAVCPIINEPATLIQMFQAKQLDQTGASGDYIAQLDSQKDAGGYSHITGANGSTFYMIFNLKTAQLANAKIRQAIVAAFDKKAYLDTVLKRCIPSYGFIPSQVSIGDKDYRTEVPEPEKQFLADNADPKALLTQGMQEANLGSDPSKIKLKLLMGPQSSTQTATAQFTQNQLESKLGIKVDIVYSVDGPTYFKDRTDGNFDLCMGGWGPDYNDVSTYFDIFLSDNPNNNGKYVSKQYDDLIKAADKELDNAKRIQDYAQAEKVLTVDDPAIVTTYYQDFQTFRYNWLKGMMLPIFGGYYDLKDVYIQGRQ